MYCSNGQVKSKLWEHVKAGDCNKNRKQKQNQISKKQKKQKRFREEETKWC